MNEIRRVKFTGTVEQFGDCMVIVVGKKTPHNWLAWELGTDEFAAGEEITLHELWGNGYEGQHGEVVLPSGKTIRVTLEWLRIGSASIDQIASELNISEEDAAQGFLP